MTPYTTAITATAASFDLDPALVEALIQVESSGNPWSTRYEPLFYSRYRLADKPHFQPDARRWAVSYGLMQIMGATAYDLGFRGEPEALLHIPDNLRYGCGQLFACQQWAVAFHAPDRATLIATLAAYNGGRNSANSPLLPRPRNLEYALRVIGLIGGRQ